MFNNKHKTVDYNYDATIDEIDERQQALNYIADRLLRSRGTHLARIRTTSPNGKPHHHATNRASN